MQEWLDRCPLIAILRGIEPSEVESVFSALLGAGIVIAEIPLNSPQPFESIELAANLFSDRMLIGAGTVTRLEDVERVKEAGAQLIVSPHADPEIVRETKRFGLFSLPGVGTATEAFAMANAGADALKLFPADVMGTRMLTGLRAVLPPETRMIPVGGVDHSTIPMWRKAGANGFGVGSALYKPGMTSAQVAVEARHLVERLKADRDQ
jgi:2-dehydro-3-deoxyphosphogalactonate aldolase